MSEGGTVRAFAFDLDDTLAPSKEAIGQQTADLLVELLSAYDVCVISGGNYEQFVTQLVGRLPRTETWTRLHLMPTSGAAHYFWSGRSWERAYEQTIPPETAAQVTALIERFARELSIWEEHVWGERIENRGAQITYSALGQDAPLELKREWDPGGRKRGELRDLLGGALPDLEVRSGGSTSVDVTLQGIDKAYGIGRFLSHRRLRPTQLVFFGDRLDEGGNDHPVTTLGVRCVPVDGPDDTRVKVAAVLAELTP